jgi:hypothetical protein
MSKKKPRFTIEIDFDGVLFRDIGGIEVGEIIPGAIEFLRWCKEQGYSLILNTCRMDLILENGIWEESFALFNAKKALFEAGLTPLFTCICENSKEMIDYYGTDPTKIGADMRVDDKGVGFPLIEKDGESIPDWGRIKVLAEDMVRKYNLKKE